MPFETMPISISELASLDFDCIERLEKEMNCKIYLPGAPELEDAPDRIGIEGVAIDVGVCREKLRAAAVSLLDLFKTR